MSDLTTGRMRLVAAAEVEITTLSVKEAMETLASGALFAVCTPENDTMVVLDDLTIDS